MLLWEQRYWVLFFSFRADPLSEERNITGGQKHKQEVTNFASLINMAEILSNVSNRHLTKTIRGPWASIRSPDTNSYCISANTMQLLPVLQQQLGHTFDHTLKTSTVILVSSFEQTE